MFRFHKMICSECHGTIRRKLIQSHVANQVINPDAPITCLVCGHETLIETEVRTCVSEMKAESKKAIDYESKGCYCTATASQKCSTECVLFRVTR